MLRNARMAAMRKLRRSVETVGERQLWAVRVIRHQGLIVTDAAPCTFLNEGRKPELRCKRSERQQESDVAKSRLDCHNRQTPSARAKPYNDGRTADGDRSPDQDAGLHHDDQAGGHLGKHNRPQNSGTGSKRDQSRPGTEPMTP